MLNTATVILWAIAFKVVVWLHQGPVSVQLPLSKVTLIFTVHVPLFASVMQVYAIHCTITATNPLDIE